MTEFSATSTTDDVLDGIDLRGKRALVTGVSAGLGVETARALVAHGCWVVGAARNLEKAQVATQIVRQDAANGGGFELVHLDLASLKSVRQCADELNKAGKAFDLVIANAGVMAPPMERTEDGFELQFGSNHLGHFVLVNRIAPLVKAGGRVVVLASSAHQSHDVNLDDPNFLKTEYSPYDGYGASKTANILFAVEFDRRHRDRGVRACAVHPGGVATELMRYTANMDRKAAFEQMNAARAAKGKAAFFIKSLKQGAATTVWAAARASADEIGGRYCEDCHLGPVVQDNDPMGPGVNDYAVDPARAKALWAKSEEIVGEKF